jgi:beta-keto acid cleavage enzyme
LIGFWVTPGPGKPDTKAWQAAGASLVHVHIRDDEHRSTMDPGRLRDTVACTLRTRISSSWPTPRAIASASSIPVTPDPEAVREVPVTNYSPRESP